MINAEHTIWVCVENKISISIFVCMRIKLTLIKTYIII